MSDTCTHDCAACGEACGERTEKQAVSRLEPNRLSQIKKVIGVMSGKGGVGKSLVTSMLAVLLRRRGCRTAILDADVTGPSIPRAFGLTGKAAADGGAIIPLETKTGIPVISLNLLLEHETDPVVWRGPLIAGVVEQFWTDVVWGDVDYLFVDLPPGTGDVPMTVLQSLPLDGVVVVTSPQELVGMIVEKAVNMAALMKVPVLGLVENMSFFQCPDCGSVHHIFGESRIGEIAARHGIGTVCRLPLDPELAAAADRGAMEDIKEDGLDELVDTLTGKGG